MQTDIENLYSLQMVAEEKRKENNEREIMKEKITTKYIAVFASYRCH